MAQVERIPEQHGAIRYLTYSESLEERQERNRSFVAVVFFHASLIGALAFTPAANVFPPSDTSPISFFLDTDESIPAIYGNFAPPPRAGSPVGEKESAPSRPRRSAPRLLGVPVPPAPPAVVPTSISPPMLAGTAVPMPDPSYAQSLIDKALAGQSDPLGIERAIGTRKTIEQLMEGPTTTPFTRAPTLLNPGEIQSFLLRRYPASLQAAGLGGRAVLWLLIDEKGEVRKALIHTGSGYKELDKAAMDAVPKMEFSAAMHNGRNVPVWVQQPINFRVH